MKYQVIYYKNKNKKKKVATFYEIEDAIRWENYIKEKGYIDSQILVK